MSEQLEAALRSATLRDAEGRLLRTLGDLVASLTALDAAGALPAGTAPAGTAPAGAPPAGTAPVGTAPAGTPRPPAPAAGHGCPQG